MKYLFTLLILFVGSQISLASDTTIVFRQINHTALFETARKEHKGVMLYFHFDGCGACVKMEKNTFNNPNVAEFYNKNFINFKINTLKGEGIEINKIYNVKIHPTFILFDHLGNEIHRMVGVFSPDKFYERANDALLHQKNLYHYKQLYHSGKRDPDFLFNYVNILRDAYELDSFYIKEYLKTQHINDLKSEKNIRFMYEYAIHQHVTCIPFNSTAYKFMSENKDQFARYFDLEQVNTRLMFITKRAAYDAIANKDTATFWQAIDALKEYDNGQDYNFKEMDGRITRWTTTKTLVLSTKIYFYEQIGDQKNYNLHVQQYIEKIWDDAEELNSYAWEVVEETPSTETEKIQTAIKCSIRSITLKNIYSYNDTYAWLLYKSGEKTKALEQSKKAIAIARENNQDYSETQKLVDLINNEKK